MISICCAFYPWYRKTSREEEVFDVLVKGLNFCEGLESLELVFVNAGSEDVWGYKRVHDKFNFKNRLKREFKGILKYIYSKDCICTRLRGRRFWGARAWKIAAENSKFRNLFLVGIDMWFPKNFIEMYFERVKDGVGWVAKPYNIPRGGTLALPKRTRVARPGHGWHGARGMVGITKKDYYKIGGYDDENFIMTNSDSNFYVRMKKNLTLIEQTVPGFFHVGHVGSNFANGRCWNMELVEERERQLNGQV